MNWPTTRLRYVADLNPGIRADLLQAPDVEVSFLPMDAIGEDGTLDLSRNRAVAEVRNGYSYFEEGDVAFAKVTPCFENGKGASCVAWSSERALAPRKLQCFGPKKAPSPGF
jgi:type I restriction enzyme S subunit